MERGRGEGKRGIEGVGEGRGGRRRGDRRGE